MKNKIALCWTSTTIKYDFPLRDITLWGGAETRPYYFHLFCKLPPFRAAV